MCVDLTVCMLSCVWRHSILWADSKESSYFTVEGGIQAVHVLGVSSNLAHNSVCFSCLNPLISFAWIRIEQHPDQNYTFLFNLCFCLSCFLLNIQWGIIAHCALPSYTCILCRNNVNCRFAIFLVCFKTEHILKGIWSCWSVFVP